jgi:hypothetical protein
VAAAFFLGTRLLGVRLEWPPEEDRHRFLLILLPATVVVALLAALLDRRPWAAWLVRLLLAVAAAPILLHDSVHLRDTPGAESRKWTTAQTVLILGGLAVGLLGVWAALDRMARRRGGATRARVALAVTLAGAAATVMYSGYVIGGQLGLPLAGALFGTAVVSWPLSRWAEETASVSIGVVGLFGLLVIGLFFGSLTTWHAGLLFAAPVLCWVPELPWVRRLWPCLTRGILGVLLVAVPVAVAVTQARETARQESGPAASPSGSEQDYRDYERSLQGSP